MLKSTFIGVFLSFWLVSCVTTLEDQQSRNYDNHEIKTQFLSLFNQRVIPAVSTKNWKGDWLFRRERLTLVDRELMDVKADLVIFQETMERSGNRFESDKGILSSSSLKGYKWASEPIEQYQDTGEVESLSLAVTLPLTLKMVDSGAVFRVGASVFSYEQLVLEEQVISVLNLKIDDKVTDEEMQGLTDLIKSRLSTEGACRERILIAVYAAADVHDRLVDFAGKLGLQDVAKGFCNIESKCYTSNPRNEVFYVARGENPPARTDFLFVPKSAQITFSHNNFTEGQHLETSYYKSFGLSSLWAGERAGWLTNLRFARCEK